MSLPLPPLPSPHAARELAPSAAESAEGNPRRVSRRSLLTPPAVLALSLLLTTATTVFFRTTARAQDVARFENSVRMTQERIAGHLNSDVALLRGTAGFFAASEAVTPEEFRLYVEQLDLKRYDPGIQGIGFTQRIPAHQLPRWRARLEAQGHSPPRIWPESAREEYHAVLYLEPQDARNRAALGYDMFTEPTRREAMERAWLTGAPALSGKVTLKQEIDAHKQAGFLLYVPLYRDHGVPDTEAERREKLEGFVYCPFRAGDLFSGLFTPDHHARVSFALYDGREAHPEQLLYDSATPEAPRPAEPVFTSTARMEVAGRPWTLVFTSQPSFEQSLMAPWAPGVGVVGGLISLMLFTFARSQVNARKRAEDNEAERAWLLSRERAARAETEAQRTWLHELFMQAPALIAILRGPWLVFEFANTAYQEAMGRRDLMGKPLQEAFPDLGADIIGLFEAAYRTGQPQLGREVPIPIAYSGVHPEERYWNFVFQPRHDAQGGVDGVMLFAFDVTAQVQARQEVELSREEARRSAAQLQTITDTLPALVAYIDPAERYRFGNGQYESWFGITVEDMLGKTVREVIGEAGYANLKDYLRRGLAGEKTRYETELPLKNGQKAYVQITYIPDLDDQGHVRGIVALAHDITDRKKAEEAVRHAVRLRDEFLSVASHELKTPLTSLSLKLQTLAREVEAQPDMPFARKARGHVEMGRKQIKRLSDLIGDLLDVSRISSGQMKLRPEPVDFAALTREVVTRLEPEATRAESALSLEAPERLEGHSDRMRLEQVVENLLTNAIKYGAGQPIHVRLAAEGEQVVLSVRDEGIGIAPEHQARIFDRFERAVSERNYGGLGLGLYITRTIVEALGGTIHVQSQPGQGALFTVALPREPPAPPAR